MNLRLSSSAIRMFVPAASLVALLAAVFWLQPRAMSYTGLNLLLNLAVPIALATIAQMFIIAVNDLDLSMGTFVSFAACVAVNLPAVIPCAWCPDPARRGSGLRLPWRRDLSSQSSRTIVVHPRHELRLGRPCRALAAFARRIRSDLGDAGS